MRLLLLIAPTVFFAVYGQLITKWRVQHLANGVAPDASIWIRAAHYLADPYVLSTYLAAIAGSIAWLLVVERAPVAVAFPIYVGSTVLLVAVAGIVLFDEAITPSRLIGMALIVAGVGIGSR